MKRRQKSEKEKVTRGLHCAVFGEVLLIESNISLFLTRLNLNQ